MDFGINTLGSYLTGGRKRVEGPRPGEIDDMENRLEIEDDNLSNAEVYEDQIEEEKSPGIIKRMKNILPGKNSKDDNLLATQDEMTAILARLSKLELCNTGMIVEPTIAPPHFPVPPETSLLDPSGFKRAHMQFPREKFSGMQGAKLNVSEWMKSANLAQRQLGLSEKDFLNMLVSKTTENAHSLMTNWLEQNLSCKDIYFQLYATFNTEISALRASDALANYCVVRGYNFSHTVADISHLSVVSAKDCKDETTKQAIQSMNAMTCLMNRTPKACKKYLEEVYIKLQQATRQRPTFNEFTKTLIPHLNILNDDLMNDSTYSYAKPREMFALSYVQTKSPQTNNQRFEHHNKRGSINAVSSNAVKPVIKRRHSETPQGSRPKEARGPLKDQQTGTRPKTVNTLERTRPTNQQYPRPTTRNYTQDRNNYRPTNSNSGTNNGTLYCQFCGRNNHDDTRGCYSIRDDNLKHAYITPAQRNCATCEKKLNKKLKHPAAYCPLRPTMITAYDRGLVRPLEPFRTYYETEIKNSNRSNRQD